MVVDVFELEHEIPPKPAASAKPMVYSFIRYISKAIVRIYIRNTTPPRGNLPAFSCRKYAQ